MNKKKVAFALLLFAGGSATGGYFARPEVDRLIGRGDIRATVIRERRDEERLLLTLRSGNENILATFRTRADDIDELVSPGDRITLRMRTPGVFADDATIVAVSRGGAPEEEAAPTDEETTAADAEAVPGEGEGEAGTGEGAEMAEAPEGEGHEEAEEQAAEGDHAPTEHPVTPTEPAQEDTHHPSRNAHSEPVAAEHPATPVDEPREAEVHDTSETVGAHAAADPAPTRHRG